MKRTNKRKNTNKQEQRQPNSGGDSSGPLSIAEALKGERQSPSDRPVEPMNVSALLEELNRPRPVLEEKAHALTPEPPAQAVAAAAALVGMEKRYGVIKLGIDVHLQRYVVCRQIEGGVPQPAQGFTPEQFLKWAEKQTKLAKKVYCCYEAGPFGYGLHRQLTALGIINYVVRPRDWDEYGKNVKTDQRDAKELVLALDRYVGGNKEAFSTVRVPTEAEEQRRSRTRQRESLEKQRQRLAAQGRGQALYYGCRLKGEWWTQSAWKKVVLPPIVLELLEPLRRLIEAVEKELAAQTNAIMAAAPAQLPIGMGRLTYEILEREICDWSRFTNRRQVGSYSGMCPWEDSSDQRRFQGSINKHGNRRVRHALVEASWRLILWQRGYKPVKKWLPTLLNPKTTKSKRKQIAVAIGRQFGVDWWRVRTKRCQPEDLGLQLNPLPTAKTPTPKSKSNAPSEKEV